MSQSLILMRFAKSLELILMMSLHCTMPQHFSCWVKVLILTT